MGKTNEQLRVDARRDAERLSKECAERKAERLEEMPKWAKDRIVSLQIINGQLVEKVRRLEREIRRIQNLQARTISTKTQD